MSQTEHLNAEIEFWQELLDKNQNSLAESSVTRMRQALALAEKKLLMLQTQGLISHPDQLAKTSGYRKQEH